MLDDQDFSAASLAAELEARARRIQLELVDAKEPAGETPRARFRRLPELVDRIQETARLPWIEVGLTADRPLARGRVGSCVLLIGWEGSGKSSLVMQLGLALTESPSMAFVYLTTELDDDEAAARAIGIRLGESWEDVQRGKVSVERMREAADRAGFIVLAREDASLSNLEAVVKELRLEEPTRQIVVAIDYLQDLEEDKGDLRMRTAQVSRAVRRFAKALGVFAIAVSQTSRANKVLLKSGEASGADTSSSGAESSQLERDAYVTLALGRPRERDDGKIDLDLSVGKARLGGGDRVWPMRYEGRTGRFVVLGDAKSSSEIKKEAVGDRERVRLEEMKGDAMEELEGERDAISVSELARRIRGDRTLIYMAVKELRMEGKVVNVGKRITGGGFRIAASHVATKYEMDVTRDTE